MARIKDKEKKSLKRREKSDKNRLKLDRSGVRSNGLLGNVTRTFSEINHSILLLVIVLCVFGVLSVYSAGYYQTVGQGSTTYYLKRQLFFMATGSLLLVFGACYDYHKWTRWALPLLVLSIVLLLFVLAFGASANGAQRWIGIGPVRITPSEISKVAMIIYTSVFLAADPRRNRGKYIIYLMAVMAVHFVLVFEQPNLSTAIVISAIMLGIMFIAGLRLIWIGAFAGLGVAGTFAILNFAKGSHWYSRLTSFRDPFADMQGSGYQVSQSLIALGNGGLKGLGVGNSITKNLYLPEPQNDFILAVIGEEIGFIGVALLMCVYIILFYQCIMTAAKAKDRLGFYLAAGVAIMLGLQVVINVAVVTSSMPATGITLPFVSYGGTSIWVFMLSMGILLNISRGQRVKKSKKRMVQ